jgi:hypothetical protein
VGGAPRLVTSSGFSVILAATMKYRLLFDWPAYESALRSAAKNRKWSDAQITAALQRDRLCSIEVDDLEVHLDWHERLGFEAPTFGLSQG